MRRQLAATLTLIALALLVAGCDVQARKEIAAEKHSTQQGPPGPQRVAAACTTRGHRPQIGLIPINLEALFFNQIDTGAQTIATRAGADLHVVNGNNSSQTQSNTIDNMVASKYDAIIVDAVDTEGVKPAVRRARAAGVPVVAVDAIVGDPAVSTQVGIQNSAGGTELGQALLRLSGGKGDVGIVGALNSTIQLERQKGFTDSVKAGGMSVAGVVDGRNIQEDAQTSAENLLTAHPNMPYAYATGEPALIGLIAAVKSQNRTRNVKVVGWDLSDQAAGGLRAGWVRAVLQQPTFEFGYQAMNAAVDLACHRSAPKNIPVHGVVLTPDNLTKYLYYLEK